MRVKSFPDYYIGTASWNIPTSAKSEFLSEGSHLERYSKTFTAVEINSSFYRIHKSETYSRWAECVPESFRFSVKLLKKYTHEQKLKGPYADLSKFFLGIKQLGYKFAVLLIQLPPSLSFELKTAVDFFEALRNYFDGDTVVEPRHSSWLSADAESIFKKYALGKVNADPALYPTIDQHDFQYSKILYYRLHGSPEIYKSSYSPAFIENLSQTMKLNHQQKTQWCIFDNTTFGYATHNALALEAQIKGKQGPPSYS